MPAAQEGRRGERSARVVLGACGVVWLTADAQYERRADDHRQELVRLRVSSEPLVDICRQPLEIRACVGQQELKPLARAKWAREALDARAAASIHLVHADLERGTLGLGCTAHIRGRHSLRWCTVPYAQTVHDALLERRLLHGETRSCVPAAVATPLSSTQSWHSTCHR